LFDGQPRPVALDVAIDLPAKADAPGKAQSTAAAPPALAQPATAPEMAPPPTQVAAPPSAAAATPAAQTAPSDQPAAPAAAQPSPALAKSSADATPAEPVPPSVPPLRTEKQSVATYHFAVQVGVFSDQTRVRDIRSKLEKAGLKTYVQVIQTKGGPRGVRVRVGPFALKAQALEAVRKIKALDLPADLVTL
jgi:DedD protein